MIKKKETALRRLRTSSCKWDDYKNYSPELQRDPDVCLATVMNAGMALMFIPEECRTREICLAAVAGNERAGFYQSSPLKTPASIGGGMKAAFVFFPDNGKEDLDFLKKEPFFHTVINVTGRRKGCHVPLNIHRYQARG